MAKAANEPGTGGIDASVLNLRGIDIVSRVLHRDGLMLIVDKPAGIPVHRGPRNSRDKSGAALEDYFDALRFGLPHEGLAFRKVRRVGLLRAEPLDGPDDPLDQP